MVKVNTKKGRTQTVISTTLPLPWHNQWCVPTEKYPRALFLDLFLFSQMTCQNILGNTALPSCMHMTPHFFFLVENLSWKQLVNELWKKLNLCILQQSAQISNINIAMVSFFGLSLEIQHHRIRRHLGKQLWKSVATTEKISENTEKSGTQNDFKLGGSQEQD